MRFVELPAEFVGDDFKARAQSLCIKDDLRVLHSASALKPPLAVRVAHDFAHGVVKQQFFDGL
jgi:hypothetical protein